MTDKAQEIIHRRQRQQDEEHRLQRAKDLKEWMRRDKLGDLEAKKLRLADLKAKGLSNRTGAARWQAGEINRLEQEIKEAEQGKKVVSKTVKTDE